MASKSNQPFGVSKRLGQPRKGFTYNPSAIKPTNTVNNTVTNFPVSNLTTVLNTQTDQAIKNQVPVIRNSTQNLQVDSEGNSVLLSKNGLKINVGGATKCNLDKEGDLYLNGNFILKGDGLTGINSFVVSGDSENEVNGYFTIVDVDLLKDLETELKESEAKTQVETIQIKNNIVHPASFIQVTPNNCLAAVSVKNIDYGHYTLVYKLLEKNIGKISFHVMVVNPWN